LEAQGLRLQNCIEGIFMKRDTWKVEGKDFSFHVWVMCQG